MSETPRTDAKEKETQGLAYDSAGNADPVGMRNHAHYGWKFARALERELAEARRPFHSALVELQVEIEAHKLAKADHDRLVRELDVLLYGEDAAPQASLCDIVAKVAATNVELEQIRTEGWPKLDKPARVGGGTFGVGVSTKLVVSAAQAAYANEAERRAMTKEQRQAAERNRREFWEMVNGPLEAKP